MKNINGYKIDKLPYTSLNKVCDLMYYDGPILSHYKTADNINIFYYWVDRDENYNRWLVLKVSDDDLNYYLKKVRSLKELILSNRNDYIFVIDINQDIEPENITMIESHNLISEYIPEPDSYYQLEIPDIYNLLLQKFETNTYLETLRKNAIFFRLEPEDAKYGATVGLESIREFIKNIINSYKGYFDFDFFNKFKKI
ncbi:MAG: hypothetical protein HY738_09035, partial [Bacteroidia bacterium]|nr:hypothetical protein [Bacteroidia bacterium]